MILVFVEVGKNIRSVVAYKVLVFGSFDIVHPGHTEFLKEAKKLGEHLTVVLARDVSIQKMKGHVPHFSEQERKDHLSALKFVNTVILGDEHDYFKIPCEIQPDIIALGYDQLIPKNPENKEYSSELSKPQNNLEILKSLLPHTQIVRLSAHYPEHFKSSHFRNL